MLCGHEDLSLNPQHQEKSWVWLRTVSSRERRQLKLKKSQYPGKTVTLVTTEEEYHGWRNNNIRVGISNKE